MKANSRLENKRFEIMSMVSSRGMLVNKEVTSKLAMTTLLESRLSNSWTNEKESLTI